jgi:hypothetical protein
MDAGPLAARMFNGFDMVKVSELTPAVLIQILPFSTLAQP